MKTVIFDIDGTLANISHRLHYIQDGNKNWDKFFEATAHDLPITQMIYLLKTLRADGIRIILVSGRTEKIRKLTEEWLHRHDVCKSFYDYDALYMRPENDYRKDYIIKKEILEQIRKDYDGAEILFVVDDRSSVVKMWRSEGLICLQCAEWQEHFRKTVNKGLLTLMIGPSGAGKSEWLKSEKAVALGIHPTHIISTDQLRADFCGGDFRSQTRNNEVFAALYAITKARINSGLPTVVDATNIRRADRLGVATLANGGPVRYIVVDRPMKIKEDDAGWRKELAFNLLDKHQQTFNSQLKDILSGDNLPNVEVLDMRKLANPL